MKKISILILALISTTLTSSIHAQDFQTLVDNIVNPVIEQNKWAGVILFERYGEIKALKAYGYADKENNIKNTLDTKFPLGSAGQCFSAIAILQMKEKGLLKLTDPISKYIDGFISGNKISIHNLLTGSSGIPPFKLFLNENDFDKIMKSKTSLSKIIKLIKKQNLEFEPGLVLEENVYPYPLLKANWPDLTNNILIGIIIEKLSGVSYSEYVKSNIFEPLGMTNSGAYLNGVSAENLSIGYSSINNELVKVERMQFLNFGSAANLYSTASDMLKYYKSLHTEQILSKQSIEKLTKPYSGDENRHRFTYAMAYVGDGNYGKRILYDSNEGDGYYVSLMHHYDEDITLIRLGNVGTQSPRNRPGYENYKPQPSGQWTQQLVQLLKRPDGYSAAVELRKKLEANPDVDIMLFITELKDAGTKYFFQEQEFNSLGYYSLSQEKMEQCVEIFKVNVMLFPNSANAYDSYAEGLLKKGDITESIKNYKKSLELNPQNKNALKMIEELETSQNK